MDKIKKVMTSPLVGSAMAGVVAKAAIIVDELVTADVSTGSAISDATIALGDDRPRLLRVN